MRADQSPAHVLFVFPEITVPVQREKQMPAPFVRTNRPVLCMHATLAGINDWNAGTERDNRVGVRACGSAHTEHANQSVSVAAVPFEPFQMNVLSRGTYWRVTALIASCDAIPPMTEATACISAPAHRQNS